MGQETKIEWTDHTFNPWIGCTKVSPGCEHCYAAAESKRRGWAPWGKGKPRQKTQTWHEPLKWNLGAIESGKRQRVFCASLADVFDAEINPQWRDELWELVRKTSFLDWQILTKRPKNILAMLPSDWGDGWPNVCLMTSVEDQARAMRIATLVEIPARYRGLSIEPLLGPVTIEPAFLKKLDWVIVGGESGRGARPMHPDWVRSIRRQCEDAGVMLFFKQWGRWSPDGRFASAGWKNAASFPVADKLAKPIYLKDCGRDQREAIIRKPKAWTVMFHTTKKKAGSELDGRQYREHPFGQMIPIQDITLPLAADQHKTLPCHTTGNKSGDPSLVYI